jgi:endonuclease/exonuclease/phosphatase family metal-dependent hydrolase
MKTIASPTRPLTVLRRLVATAAVSFAAYGAVAQTDHQSSNAVNPRTTIADLPMGDVGSAHIMLDGDMGDWSQDHAVTADANYLYFRFSFGEKSFTLQHAPRPVLVMIDADNDATTGHSPNASGLKHLGVDLEIEFSLEKGQGLSAAAINTAGERSPINAYDLDVVVAPTVAAPWYEGRIARSSPALASLPTKGLRSTGQAAIAVGIANAQGKFDAYSDPEVVSLPSAGQPEARLAAALIPSKAPGSVRVMSWNIERSAPAKDPQPFRRVIQAVQPDIILFQEWDTGSATDVLAWMTQWISSDAEWHVVKAQGDLTNGGGVTIVSRYELAPQLASPPLGGAGGTPVRFVSAKAAGPFGDILVASTHLKCCGSKDSPEDQKRLAEADTINKAFLFDGAPTYRIITGDMNLVGSKPPLDRLVEHLDADGTDLTAAPARVLGDSTMSTWSKSGDAFGPGRLDYALFSDSTLDALQAFILNTRRLSDEALARLGLERADSDASDHMPVVVDFKAK